MVGASTHEEFCSPSASPPPVTGAMAMARPPSAARGSSLTRPAWPIGRRPPWPPPSARCSWAAPKRRPSMMRMERSAPRGATCSGFGARPGTRARRRASSGAPCARSRQRPRSARSSRRPRTTLRRCPRSRSSSRRVSSCRSLAHRALTPLPPGALTPRRERHFSGPSWNGRRYPTHGMVGRTQASRRRSARAQTAAAVAARTSASMARRQLAPTCAARAMRTMRASAAASARQATLPPRTRIARGALRARSPPRAASSARSARPRTPSRRPARRASTPALRRLLRRRRRHRRRLPSLRSRPAQGHALCTATTASKSP